jgi:hypothetical protein
MSQVTLLGVDFKAVVNAVRKFPSVGAFAGAGVINIQAAGGVLTATSIGVTLAVAQVAADGDMGLVGVEERALDGFASLCKDSAKVVITAEEKGIVIRCRKEQMDTVVAVGQLHKPPVTDGITGIKLTETVAARVAYLSDLAFGDASRAELCAVMATSANGQAGRLMACSQKVIAVLKGCKIDQNVAIPLALAKLAVTDDIIYPGPKKTVVKSGIATYSMPAPVAAQKHFPISTIMEFDTTDREEIASVDGVKLAAAIGDAQTCLGQVARTEIISDISIIGGKLELSANNGSSRFQVTRPLLSAVVDGVLFRCPLQELVHVSPFMTDKVTLSRGKHGDLFMAVPAGWVWMPAWVTGRKKAKKKE